MKKVLHIAETVAKLAVMKLASGPTPIVDDPEPPQDNAAEKPQFTEAELEYIRSLPKHEKRKAVAFLRDEYEKEKRQKKQMLAIGKRHDYKP